MGALELNLGGAPEGKIILFASYFDSYHGLKILIFAF